MKKTKPNQKLNQMSISIGSQFKTVQNIADQLGIQVPLRKGYVSFKIGNVNYALWCVINGNNGMWENKFLNNDTIIEERKIVTDKQTKKSRYETSAEFRKRMLKSHNNPVEIRITFVKNNNKYTYAGAYMITNVDYEKAVCTYKRMYGVINTVKTSYKKVSIKLEIEQIEQTETTVKIY